MLYICLWCFNATGWVANLQEGHLAYKKLSGGMLARLPVSVWGEVQRFAYGPADATATHYLLLQ